MISYYSKLIYTLFTETKQFVAKLFDVLTDVENKRYDKLLDEGEREEDHKHSRHNSFDENNNDNNSPGTPHDDEEGHKRRRDSDDEEERRHDKRYRERQDDRERERHDDRQDDRRPK